jgi:hypothetical protein
MSDETRVRRRFWAEASGRQGGLKAAGVTVLVLLMAAAVVLLVLYGRGGGSLSGWLDFLGQEPGLLDPSVPEEIVLRTLRLAGYDHAVVGEESGTVVVRLDVPAVRTPADVELSWQTALASAAGAFPDADRYVAQVFSGEMALVEVGIDGDELREALEMPGASKDATDTVVATRLAERADMVLLSQGGVVR